MSSDAPSLRQQVIAAFVAFHVVVMVVASFPAPSKDLGEGKPNAEIDAAVAWWVGVGADLGVSAETSERVIRGVGGWWTRSLRAVHKGLWYYTNPTGSLQGWTMFGRVPTESATPEIEVRRGATWTPLYVARSDTYTWRRSLFDHDRTRTWLYEAGYKGSRAGWRSFADWTAREVRAEFPDVDEVRVQLRHIDLPPPEVLRESGELVRKDVFRVEKRRL